MGVERSLPKRRDSAERLFLGFLKEDLFYFFQIKFSRFLFCHFGHIHLLMFVFVIHFWSSSIVHVCRCDLFGHVQIFRSYSFGHVESVKWLFLHLLQNQLDLHCSGHSYKLQRNQLFTFYFECVNLHVEPINGDFQF